jgi:hypothetical protein
MSLDFALLFQGVIAALLTGVGAVVYRTSLDLARTTAILQVLQIEIRDVKSGAASAVEKLEARLDRVTCYPRDELSAPKQRCANCSLNSDTGR